MKNLVIFILSIVIVGCFYKEPNYNTKTKILLDTAISISIPKKYNDKFIDDSFQIIENIENKLSNYNNHSEIYLINKNAGIEYVSVSKETIELLKKIIFWSKKTNGYFDPTIGPLLKIWGFTDTAYHNLPSDSLIKETLQLVNYKKISIKQNSVKLAQKGMSIDLGGCLKGYAIDQVKNYLIKNNINNALISATSSLAMIGNKNNDLWRVGIIDPIKPKNIKAILNLSNISLSTSGDYQNFRIIKGKKYHHLLNPFTGYPENDFHSFTILSESAFDADILSTALFIMGNKKAISFVKKELSDKYYVAITSKNKLIYSKKLKNKIEIGGIK